MNDKLLIIEQLIKLFFIEKWSLNDFSFKRPSIEINPIKGFRMLKPGNQIYVTLMLSKEE